jgi:biotin operon repressor
MNSDSLPRAGDSKLSSDASRPDRILEVAVRERFVQHLVTLRADTRCAADLLRYFYRHPSVYITTDQLASSVGYGRGDVEAAICTLTQGGLIVQRRHQRLTATLYQLVAEKWLSGLAQAASTARGRRQLRLVLRSHELFRRAAAANARAKARLDRSEKLLAMMRPTTRAGS